MAAPIILVPGFWLGAWAWDTVVDRLRADGHDVTAMTLPGLEPDHPDRASVSLADHVDAICAAVSAAPEPVVLVVHSGAAVPGYVASDRLPEGIAAMVYVDTAPATGALDPTSTDDVIPLPPWEELEETDGLGGLTEAHLAEFRRRAVPEPGAARREAPQLSDRPARRRIPSTVVCTSYSAAEYQAAAAEGLAWLGGLAELTDITYVDLPTGHWPMWSRPDDLANLIAGVATGLVTSSGP